MATSSHGSGIYSVYRLMTSQFVRSTQRNSNFVSNLEFVVPFGRSVSEQPLRGICDLWICLADFTITNQVQPLFVRVTGYEVSCADL